MTEPAERPDRKELAAAIRRVTQIYREGGVTGTIGTADVLRMLRSQGKLAEAEELERLLARIKSARADSDDGVA
jgi:hypothetical protein